MTVYRVHIHLLLSSVPHDLPHLQKLGYPQEQLYYHQYPEMTAIPVEQKLPIIMVHYQDLLL